ncbi:hypothetical protein IW262DRAFT_1301739 [Armillaria fumosa]|nr:hypothetical protein IW262DRAFT_1301739 [Armillaria fumosa]
MGTKSPVLSPTVTRHSGDYAEHSTHQFTFEEDQLVTGIAQVLHGFFKPESDSKSSSFSDDNDKNHLFKLPSENEQKERGSDVEDFYTTGFNILTNNQDERPQKCSRMSTSYPESNNWYPWLNKIENGVDNVPSVKSMKSLNAKLQILCGIDSIPYKKALGNLYYINSLSQIIVQVWRWPTHRFTPIFISILEKVVNIFWRHARHLAGSTKYLMTLHLLWPDFQKWFTVKGSKQMYAKCWKLIPLPDSSGWMVLMSKFVAWEDQFLANFPHFSEEFHAYNLPDSCNIVGIVDAITGETTPWMLTNPAHGNSWHIKAQVPLEMLDGVMDQIETVQAYGIEAWDCELEKNVLPILFVLALLGDNPMQSEFACHISLQGKFFCHACWVMESDTSGGHAGSDTRELSDSDDASNKGGDSNSSGNSDMSQWSPQCCKLVEMYDQIKIHILAFIKLDASTHTKKQ